MKSTAILAAVAALMLGTVAPAHAETATARVQVSDLDLSTAHDRNIAKLRIARTAAALCKDPNAHLSSDVRHAERSCRKSAAEKALASLPPATRLAVK